MERKVIDMFVEPRPSNKCLYNIFCLCNDGTIWIHEIGSTSKWVQMENVPQPRSEDAVREEKQAVKDKELDEILDLASSTVGK